MALFKYFSPTVCNYCKDQLPDPKGFLSSKLPSSAIASANVEVKKVLDDEKGGLNGRKRTRGSYKKLSAEDLR